MFIVVIPTTVIILTTATPTNPVYGQPDQTSFNVTDSSNIQSIPAKKVHVGDVDIGYKIFGKGDPILLISGASDNMNGWEQSTLGNLSSTQTVIVFDNRGVGNTITGSKPFSIQQLANDTAGLLDVLKIPKADVLGYSFGATVAQQLTVTHPDKVNRLMLVGASCGGKDGISPSSQLVDFMSKIVNKILKNISITPKDIKDLISSSLGSAWVNLHPNFP